MIFIAGKSTMDDFVFKKFSLNFAPNLWLSLTKIFSALRFVQLFFSSWFSAFFVSFFEIVFCGVGFFISSKYLKIFKLQKTFQKNFRLFKCLNNNNKKNKVEKIKLSKTIKIFLIFINVQWFVFSLLLIVIEGKGWRWLAVVIAGWSRFVDCSAGRDSLHEGRPEVGAKVGRHTHSDFLSTFISL